MERAGELERFLRSRNDAGVKESEGVFTLAEARGIEKLSSHQLPFDDAWALKLIQAAVAAGQTNRIEVKLGKRTSYFRFYGGFDWTIELVEKALTDINEEKDRALRHLVVALRAVGFSQKRRFLLSSSRQSEGLLWDGVRFKRIQPEELRDAAISLQITTLGLDAPAGFLGSSARRLSAARNATVSKSLATRAHTCPVPLILGGRRLDGLEKDQQHGSAERSRLLYIGFENGELPAFAVNFDPASPAFKTLYPGRQDPGVKSEHRRSSLAFLVAAHLSHAEGGGWDLQKSHSYLHWVADGVVVDSEIISRQEELCSVGCFVCADELATDLTSFFILTEEKRRHRREVLSTLATGLEKITGLDDIDVDSFLTDRMTKLGTGFLGGMLSFFFLAAGAWPIAVLSGGISALFAFANWNEELEAKVFRSFRNVGSNLDEKSTRPCDS